MRDWLKDKRKEKELTQSEVASSIGVTQASYRYYETGERTPQPEVAKKLGKLLKFNWTKFYS